MKNIQLYNDDNLEVMKRLPNESIDVICIDPPYLYLKNQKLERPFNEQLFFSECKRLLTPNGFIVMFGRGISFYRWNGILDSLGFVFKEEIIWNKRRITSPVLPLGRTHETISVFSKGKGKINKVKIDVFEKYKFDPEKIQRIANRLSTVFGNRKTFDLLKNYYKTREKKYYKSVYSSFNSTRSKDSNINQNRTIVDAVALEEGSKEISIIDEVSDHYKTIHPTQKPVKLIERLLALVIPQDKERKDIIVADWFGGSMSTMEAVINMGMQGISTEIDKEYFEAGKNRIEKLFNKKPLN
ncbi:site-specific DNA-methyltransferase [Empedobacter sp.]|uniref:DNA-methyltransferase n=1 Tax=Empedobacter sp. TaxID=1927715 RepID=UPI0028994419|nr:site-specific DNA-methyltransferase [Empedobacter sp.]